MSVARRLQMEHDPARQQARIDQLRASIEEMEAKLGAERDISVDTPHLELLLLIQQKQLLDLELCV
jgi:hypothetical protein